MREANRSAIQGAPAQAVRHSSALSPQGDPRRPQEAVWQATAHAQGPA